VGPLPQRGAFGPRVLRIPPRIENTHPERTAGSGAGGRPDSPARAAILPDRALQTLPDTPTPV